MFSSSFLQPFTIPYPALQNNHPHAALLLLAAGAGLANRNLDNLTPIDTMSSSVHAPRLLALTEFSRTVKLSQILPLNSATFSAGRVFTFGPLGASAVEIAARNGLQIIVRKIWSWWKRSKLRKRMSDVAGSGGVTAAATTLQLSLRTSRFITLSAPICFKKIFLLVGYDGNMLPRKRSL